MPVLPTLFRGGAVPPTRAGSATATPSPRFAPRAPTRSSSTCRPSNSGAACQTGLATDLRTGNAVRFGNRNSSCSAYGIITEPVTVAEAVAASAAFPLLLPAMERTYAFTRPGAAATIQHVLLLTDGGIYDNLGLSVLEPGRSANHTAHVYDVDYIIACDAGRGTLPLARTGELARHVYEQVRCDDLPLRVSQMASCIAWPRRPGHLFVTTGDHGAGCACRAAGARLSRLRDRSSVWAPAESVARARTPRLQSECSFQERHVLLQQLERPLRAPCGRSAALRRAQ